MDWLTINWLLVVDAIAVSLAAAFIFWETHRHNVLSCRKLPLIVEHRLEPVIDQADWRKATLTVRNLNPVGAWIVSVGTWCPTAKLLALGDAIYTDDGFSSRGKLVGLLPEAEAAQRVRVEGFVGRAGMFKPGQETNVVVFVHGPCGEGDLYIEWRWADGLKD